jgi:hypothetical protein
MCSCDSNADCSGTGLGALCWGHGCGCTDDSHCKHPPWTICTGSPGSPGKCVRPCTTNADCQTFGELKTCNVANGRCVQCFSEKDCHYIPYCHVATGYCTSCLTDGHCSAARFERTCHTPGGCVECLTDQQCTAASLGTTCTGNICTCTSDKDCAKQKVGRRCDATRQACSCKTDADCPAGTTCSESYLTIPICGKPAAKGT